MFTKYSKIFLEVQKRMKNNQAVANCLSFRIKKEHKLKDIEMLISQVVFETLSTLTNKLK